MGGFHAKSKEESSLPSGSPDSSVSVSSSYYSAKSSQPITEAPAVSSNKEAAPDVVCKNEQLF